MVWHACKHRRLKLSISGRALKLAAVQIKVQSGML